MADIKELKKEEMSEIIDFYHFIDNYGHVFLLYRITAFLGCFEGQSNSKIF